MKSVITGNQKYHSRVAPYDFKKGDIFSAELNAGLIFTMKVGDNKKTHQDLEIIVVFDTVSNRMVTDKFKALQPKLVIDTKEERRTGRTTKLIDKYVGQLFEGKEVELRDHPNGNNRNFLQRFQNRLSFEHFGDRSAMYQHCHFDYPENYETTPAKVRLHTSL